MGLGEISFSFNLNLMIQISGLHAHAPKNVQEAFVGRGLSCDLNSSVPLCSFDPTAKLSIPALFLTHLYAQALVEASPFPMKSCTAEHWVWSDPFFSCQSHRYKNWQLRVGTSAPCSVWQLPTVSLKSCWVKSGYWESTNTTEWGKRNAPGWVFSTLLIKH